MPVFLLELSDRSEHNPAGRFNLPPYLTSFVTFLHKSMKKSTLGIISCFCLLSSVYADEVWAPGVSISGGWYDFDKSNGSEWHNDDSLMCWAASSANVIAWWQSQNKAIGDNQWQTIPQGVDIWKTFVGVYENGGSNPRYAFDWWINGTNISGVGQTDFGDDNPTWIGIDGKEYHPYTYQSGGILTSNVYNSTPLYDSKEHSTSLIANENIMVNCAAQLVSLLNNHAMAVEVATDVGKPAHAITLWGVEYHLDSSGNTIIDYAYITDSDFDADQLVKAQVDGKGYLCNMPTENLAYRITHADGMWSEAVPEPSTCSLSLLALTAWVLRRRRK